MSLTNINLASLVTRMSTIGSRLLGTSRTQKMVAMSVTLGIFMLGVLVHYMKKKKSKRRNSLKDSSRRRLTYSENQSETQEPSAQRSPSVRSLRRQGSVLSGYSGTSEADRKTPGYEPLNDLTPQQLGVMGMEALQASISYWEDALSTYMKATSANLAITGEEDSEFCKDLQKLLDLAYKIQDECELLFLDQRSILFRRGSSVQFGTESEFRSELQSPADSFVSAEDNGWQMADLREFDEFTDENVEIENLQLYQSALKHFEDEGIPSRCLRTEIVRCGSDVEYLCKLHCIRNAFKWLFKDSETWIWFANAGRQVLTDLLKCADKDTHEFLISYEEMLDFLQNEDSWNDVMLELAVRGLKTMTFYDIVLDYILMDAFEDLDSPPSTVSAVVNNRWLSDGFKETALSTAVWSVLKAKRRMLKFQNGFMAHFYSISEKISPLMAWGFLGPDEDLKDTCQYFKDQIMQLLTDIFSFQQCRYTTVEELSEDIMIHIRTRVDNINDKLSFKINRKKKV